MLLLWFPYIPWDIVCLQQVARLQSTTSCPELPAQWAMCSAGMQTYSERLSPTPWLQAGWLFPSVYLLGEGHSRTGTWTTVSGMVYRVLILKQCLAWSSEVVGEAKSGQLL